MLACLQPCLAAIALLGSILLLLTNSVGRPLLTWKSQARPHGKKEAVWSGRGLLASYVQALDWIHGCLGRGDAPVPDGLSVLSTPDFGLPLCLGSDVLRALGKHDLLLYRPTWHSSSFPSRRPLTFRRLSFLTFSNFHNPFTGGVSFILPETAVLSPTFVPRRTSITALA